VTWRGYATAAGLCGACFLAGYWSRPGPIETVPFVERNASSQAAVAAARDLKIAQVIPPKVVIRRTIKAPDGTLTTDEREETGPGSQVIQEASKIAASRIAIDTYRESVVARVVQPRWGLQLGVGADPLALARGNRDWTVDVAVMRHLSKNLSLGVGATRAGGTVYLSARVGVSF
jgi:hypothetical protein